MTIHKNQAYNFTVNMKNGDSHVYPCMTFRQFGNAAKDIVVSDIDNIDQEVSVMPEQRSNSNDILNYILGKKA